MPGQRLRRGGRQRLHALWAALTLLALAAPAQAAQQVNDIDPATGTPRVYQQLDSALSAPSSDDPLAIADSWVQAHLPELGLDRADYDALLPAKVSSLPGGVSSVRWRQGIDGVLAADHS